MLYYAIQPHSLRQHLWQVSLRFTQDQQQDFSLSLPNWVPGSYMIRDFARHIVSLQAQCNGQSVRPCQTSKNTWSFTGQAGTWQITYLVYAFDLSVRGSFLNEERGFFDGACVFLRHNQRQQEHCQLHIDALPENWDIATTLTKTAANTYQADDYRHLIDHPAMMGTLLRLPFQAAGIDHEIVINGHYADFDQQQLVADVQKICTTEINFFAAPAPFERYCFLLFVGQNLYGGLEHASSTALMADRHDLPQAGEHKSDQYITLLGLFSHEYFHAWNVKSIKPAAFADSDLNQEAYTRLLWAFEGITSYYDDLFLVRSGVISAEQYLNVLAKTLTRVQQGQGRLHQTLAESSFEAWTKYYKQNENSANTIVSYYQKGALAALCLDQVIRQRSAGQYSLDDVMRALYQDWRQRRQALAETEWLQQAQQTTGLDLQDVYHQYIETTIDLPLVTALGKLGVQLTWQPLPASHGGCYATEPAQLTAASADLGARFQKASPGICLTQLTSNGSAEQAGLCAGDQLIALNQEIIDDFAKQWARVKAGQSLSIHYIRDGLLQQTQLLALTAPANTALLHITDTVFVQNWLTDTHHATPSLSC